MWKNCVTFLHDIKCNKYANTLGGLEELRGPKIIDCCYILRLCTDLKLVWSCIVTNLKTLILKCLYFYHLSLSVSYVGS